jgi:hypothetical protein
MKQATLFCQRWRERRDSYRPEGEPIDPHRYEVAPIEMRTAKDFVLEHHYSASYPSCRWRYGLFDRAAPFLSTPYLVGVAVFSVPRHPNVLTNVFGGHVNESTELGRFVLLDLVPANGETWFLSRCRELLPTGLRGLVAFSDDTPRKNAVGDVVHPGHIGNIYQAENAVYLGRGAKATQYLFADGTAFDPRAKSKIRNRESGWSYATRILIERGADEPGKDLRAWLDHWLPLLTTSSRKQGNHKYAWALDRKIRLPDSRLYPKRSELNGHRTL